MKKIYPDSGVELNSFTAKHYDTLMNSASFGLYKGFIKKAIKNLNINDNDAVLDMGCGTGRNILLMNKFSGKNSRFTGMDISLDMEKQFIKNTKQHNNINFINKRIDEPFELNKKFDKIFISFVIHGFPHEIRKNIIKNAFNHLKEGGSFLILDFAEFDMDKMPFHHRFVFKKIECKYAFDYIKKDWKNILHENGFYNFEEKLYFKKYVRLLKAVKK